MYAFFLLFFLLSLFFSDKPVGAAPLSAFGGYLRRYLKNGDYFA
jgi:hypothetical protein